MNTFFQNDNNNTNINMNNGEQQQEQHQQHFRAADFFASSHLPQQATTATTERIVSARPTTWQPVQVPGIPPFYVMEMTKVVVEATPVATVADRIARCLCRLSLDATFNNEEAWAMAEDSTLQTRLMIRLYSMSESQILVEVQRRSGCSVSFHRYARAVLRAVQSDSAPITEGPVKRGSAMAFPEVPAPKKIRRGLLAAPRPTLRRSRAVMDSNNTTTTEGVVELENAIGLLKKDRLDAKRLGMESLVHLMNDETTTTGVALFASRTLLGTQSEAEEEASMANHEVLAWVRNFVVSYIVQENVNVEGSELERHFDAIMHNCALTATANALSTLSKQRPAELAKVGVADRIVPCLVEQVRQADSHPHAAYQATRSLLILLKNPNVLGQLGSDFNEVMTQSRAVGQCRHLLLEQESGAVLDGWAQLKKGATV